MNEKDAPQGKILIVDDNKQNLQILGNILHMKGYQIAMAKDGPGALKIVGSTKPDLILLDIMMPGMDGYEVCEKLKTNAETKNIPVIFLTAKTETEDIVNGFVKGGVDYITKPFQKEELLVRINTHIQLKHSQDIIKKQAEELKEMNEAKDHMFSIIGHDLRGPLSYMKSIVDILAQQDHDLDEETLQQNISSLKQNTDQTFNLLENLLYWSRTQRGIMISEPEDFELQDIIEETLPLVQGSAASKNISIQSQKTINLEVYADPNMVKTILRNLLANAIKFTHSGGNITINAEEKEDAMIAISVTDNGVGMSEDEKNKIFQSNQFFTKYGTNNEKGSGLGLALCKDFAGKNKGDIYVNSQEGKGSTFTFTLPKAG